MSAAKLSVQSLTRVRLEPGDTLVVRTNFTLTGEQATALKSIICSGIQPGVHVLVLDHRVSIAVLGSEGNRNPIDGAPA